MGSATNTLTESKQSLAPGDRVRMSAGGERAIQNTATAKVFSSDEDRPLVVGGSSSTNEGASKPSIKTI